MTTTSQRPQSGQPNLKDASVVASHLLDRNVESPMFPSSLSHTT